MPDIYKTICKQCGGGCCRGYEIFLTKAEKEKIKKAGHKFKCKKTADGFLTALKNNSACVFLNFGVGCVLKKKLKPFDCDLFPVGFIYNKGVFKFYLLKECLYYKKIPKIKINLIKRQTLLKLKIWSQREIEAYSRLIAARPKADLFPV